MRILVECCTGYRGEETPRRLDLGAGKLAVIDVIDRWLAPDHRYFKVQGDDGGVYMVRHDLLADRWAMVMFDDARPTRPRGPGFNSLNRVWRNKPL